MRKSFFFLFLLVLSSCASLQSVLYVPANETVVVDYPGYDTYSVTLKNKSFSSVDVAVVDKVSENQVRGFGLGVKAKADLFVESENQLVLRNTNNSDVFVAVGITERSRPGANAGNGYRKFELENTTDKLIPIFIPSVMNPNLSANSKSKVDLKLGQQILFRSGGKRHVLLTVDESIENETVIDVAELIAMRKKELGLR